ncbi:MAG TPA: SDR family oxidoreductase [Solirubrobacter sp.]|nr:SDR family oxidoreductase [Solirubrobacter sp.]
MRVFLTGASGHIGSAVIPELQDHGHTVVGLARSDDAAATVAAAGADVLRGDLTDLDGLARAAQQADGVIHLAFRHDIAFSGDMAGAAASDLAAIATIGDALANTGKHFVTTGGSMMLWIGGTTGRPGTEDDVFDGDGRIASENATVALAERGVRASVIRLAPSVHSARDRHGFVPTLIEIARENGVSGYVGDGANRWPAIHTLDAAVLYRRALEDAPPGSRLHGVAETGIPFRTIAEAIGRVAHVPAAPAAPDRFRFLSAFVAADNPTDNTITRRLLDWEPAHPGLIEDLDAGVY